MFGKIHKTHLISENCEIPPMQNDNYYKLCTKNRNKDFLTLINE